MRTLIVFLATCLVAGTAYAYDLIAIDDQERENLGIATAVVKSSPEIKSLGLPALVVVPNDQLHIISSKQSGLVKQLFVVEGDPVTQGQELVKIQSSDFLELQRDYLQLYSRYSLSKISLDRAREAYKEGIISEGKKLALESEYYQLSAARDEKREALKLSGLLQEEINNLEKSKAMVSDFTVCSPIDGVVLNQFVSAGERIDAATAIYKVGKLKPLWIEIHVPLPVIKNTKPGNAVYIPEHDIKGTITTIGKQVHDADQGILVRAVVNEGSDFLRPGQFIQVQIVTNGHDMPYVEVSSNALVYTANRAFVFVEKPGGFQPVEVSVVSTSGPYSIVSGDIPAGTSVAIAGTSALKAIMMGIGGEG